MPYSIDSPPERIKDLPKHAQEIWIAAFNNALDEYKDEGKANATAWSAVKKDYEQDADGKWHKKKAEAARIQRGEIIALADSVTAADNDSRARMIQILRVGDFEDMNGTEVPINSVDLDAYVKNSNALLASEQVPVEIGHPDDPGAPAAAWYRKFFKKVVDGVEWVCAEIELSALGVQSLTDQLYKYFSANLDLAEKVICGGGFVNRPAITGQQPIGTLATFLRPHVAASVPKGGTMGKSKSLINRIRDAINGALNVAELEMSQEDLHEKIYQALKVKYSDPMDDWGKSLPFIIQTYDDRVVVCKGDRYFQIPYTLNADNEVELGEPVEGDVAMNFTPKSSASAGDNAALGTMPAPESLINPAPTAVTAAMSASAAGNIDNSDQPKGGDSNMSKTQTNQPDPAVTTTVPVTAQAPIPPAVNPLPIARPDASLSVADQLSQAREEARLAAETQMRDFDAQLAKARKDAWDNAQVEMTRKQEVAALAQKLTGGLRQLPFKTAEIEEALLKLTDADRAVMTPILEKIQVSGLVPMGELGSSGPGRGHKELPAYAKPLLKAWLAKGSTAQEFFAVNPELGIADQYDLYEFEKKT